MENAESSHDDTYMSMAARRRCRRGRAEAKFPINEDYLEQRNNRDDARAVRRKARQWFEFYGVDCPDDFAKHAPTPPHHMRNQFQSWASSTYWAGQERSSGKGKGGGKGYGWQWPHQVPPQPPPPPPTAPPPAPPPGPPQMVYPSFVTPTPPPPAKASSSSSEPNHVTVVVNPAPPPSADIVSGIGASLVKAIQSALEAGRPAAPKKMPTAVPRQPKHPPPKALLRNRNDKDADDMTVTSVRQPREYKTTDWY